jgi:predicted nucleic acid-binding protein
LAQLYQDFIVDGKNTTFVPISDATAALAAEVRAKQNITLADAFHVSVAIGDGCDAFLTNDSALTRVTRISVILLDDLET